ncbi:MAG: PHP domain-containing protein [Clostridia bacterium]|nr:PHP domain-containing protein [Clostridia bacterium]
MAYLYETHMHTCTGSACGVSTGSEHVRYYKDIGYTGIIITDHFFHGNTAVDRTLPWEKRIDLFCSGYEEALEEGQKVGLDVFFGWEQHFNGDEYLVYGLDKAYMKAHPEMEFWTRAEQLAAVHEAGGCVIQAHPFRLRQYMSRIRIGARFADGIEAANAGNRAVEDARALRMGWEQGLVMTAGSDNHHSPSDRGTFGVALDERLTCIGDYVKLILNKGHIGLYVPEERFAITPEIIAQGEPDQAYVLDAEEKDVRTDRNWLFDA